MKLKDKYGNSKKLFHVNKLWILLKKYLNIDLQIPYLFGYWTDRTIKLNTVTNAGFALSVSQLNGSTTAPITHIGLGVGTPGASALGSESTTNGGERAAATKTIITTNVTDDTLQLYKLFTFSGNLALTEEGVFNNSTGGVMFASQSFSVVNISNGDLLEITHKFIYN